MSDTQRLHHLLDRMLRGVLLPAEREQLAGLVGELEAHAGRRDRTATHRLAVLGKRREQIRALEAEVTRLTAGQCLDSRRMCEQHHTPPVTGCPYPQCVAARKQQECVHTGANAEDCPACPEPPTA